MSLDTEKGRGLPLMYTIMDSVEFNDAGNEVTLIRHRAIEGSDAD
jgi:anti-sigma regulatory factor (Ser/Thr protein kinase)